MRLSMKLVIALLGIALLSSCASKGEVEAEFAMTASGFIEARTTLLSSEVNGRVAEVYYPQGAQVSAGEPLLRLDWPDLAAARLQAEAQVQAAAGFLKSLEGQPAAETLAAAEAEVARARALLDEAEAQEALLRSSFSPADPPDEQLHAAQAAVEIARAGLALARAQRAQTQAGPRAEELEAARAGLAEARAGLGLVELQAQRLTISSPARGTVGQILLDPGEVALAGSPLVQILDTSDLRLTVFIPAGWLERVSPGDNVRVHVDAFPDESFQGMVLRVSDQAQFTPTNVQTSEERVKQVFQVVVQLADSDGRLKPGMPADAGFEQP